MERIVARIWRETIGVTLEPPFMRMSFDEAELHRLNAAVVHHLPFARVAHLLPQGMGATGWAAIRPNLAHMGEAAEWCRRKRAIS